MDRQARRDDCSRAGSAHTTGGNDEAPNRRGACDRGGARRRGRICAAERQYDRFPSGGRQGGGRVRFHRHARAHLHRAADGSRLRRASTAAARSRDLVHGVRKGVRQSLFRRHENAFVLGADDERGHHFDRYALRLCFRGGDRGRLEKARARSCRSEIRHHHPCPWRSCRRRQADARPLRRSYRYGRARLGFDRKVRQSISEWQARAGHRGSRWPKGDPRRCVGYARADPWSHARNRLDVLSGKATAAGR